MDRSRYKRSRAQSQRHTNKINSGISQSVTEFVAVNNSQSASSNQPAPATTIRPAAIAPRGNTQNLRPANLQPQPRAHVASNNVAARTKLGSDTRDRLRTPKPAAPVAPTVTAAPAAPVVTQPQTPVVAQAIPVTRTPKPISNEFVSVPKKPVVTQAPKAKISRATPLAAAPVTAQPQARTPISAVMPQLASVEQVQQQTVPAMPETVDLNTPVDAPNQWLDAIAHDGAQQAPVAEYDDNYEPGFFDNLAEKIDGYTAKASQKLAVAKQQFAEKRAQRAADKAARQAEFDAQAAQDDQAYYDQQAAYDQQVAVEQAQLYEQPVEQYAEPVAEPEQFEEQFAQEPAYEEQQPVEEPAYVAPAAIEPVAAEQAPQPVAQTAPNQKVLTGLGPLDMELPGEEAPSMFTRMRSRKVRRWAFRGMAAGMVLVITMGGLLVSQSYLKANKVFQGSTGTAAALKKEVTPDLLDGEGSGRINVLLLGRGGGTHDAPDLTDTIMIASIDPVNKKTTLLSIPRDLWVTVPGQGVSKLNAAFQKGVYQAQGSAKTNSTDPAAIKAGFKLVDQTISEATGLTINYNMVVNFDAFKQAVDSVNGVSVNVPTDLVDPTMAWENANDPVLAHAGPQVMNGVKALQYSRSRETTSDFARSERQRAIMVALKDKIVSLGTLSNPTKLSGLINAFGNSVTTDLSIKNAARLYEITKGITDANTTSLDLASGENALLTTGNITGQSVVLPKAGLFKYDAIKEALRVQLKDPYILKENARVTVLNGSTMPGLATAQGNQLKSYGYNVTSTANTPTSGYTQTTIVDLTKGKDKFTKHYLEQRYGVTAKTTMPNDTIATNNADFVIIIGSDQATPSQTTAR